MMETSIKVGIMVKLITIITKGCMTLITSIHILENTFWPFPNFSDSTRLKQLVGVIKKKHMKRMSAKNRIRLKTTV